MSQKKVWALAMVCFAMSALLSAVGIITVIQAYFDVSIYWASIYVSIFAGALGVSSLFTPALFSKYEKKKTIMVILIATAICNLIQIFISNYFAALILRIIPAILYPIAVSASLTIIEKTEPEYTNRVVLGISAGSILGLSITSYLGLTYGYQICMLWFAVIAIVTIITTALFIPEFEGNKEPVVLQISHAKSKLFLYSIIYIFFMLVGISITYNFIPTYLDTVTHMETEMLVMTLFLMGMVSLLGTTLSGHLIGRNRNIAILFYPIGFTIIMFVVGFFARFPFYEFCALMFFSLFDGSAYTIAQYCVTSSARESPEFANGIFLFMCNSGIFLGTMLGGIIIENIHIYYIFFSTMAMMLLSIPFVVIRIKKYPDAR